MTKVFAIRQQEHKQPLFCSAKTYVPHFKLHARMIKFHEKYFIESIPRDKVNPDKIRQNRNCYNNIHGIENKLTRFQIYSETELACKYEAIFRNNCQIQKKFQYERRKITK